MNDRWRERVFRAHRVIGWVWPVWMIGVIAFAILRLESGSHSWALRATWFFTIPVGLAAWWLHWRLDQELREREERHRR